jgi:hypothetical protein
MSEALYKNFPKVLMVMVALGFAGLAVELIGINHGQGGKLPGLIAAVVGAVLAFVGLSESPALRRILAILFIVLSLSGLYGSFVAHSGSRNFRATMAAGANVGEDRALRRAMNSFTLMPPPLAPLALTGLSLMGAVFTTIGSAAIADRMRLGSARA